MTMITFYQTFVVILGILTITTCVLNIRTNNRTVKHPSDRWLNNVPTMTLIIVIALGITVLGISVPGGVTFGLAAWVTIIASYYVIIAFDDKRYWSYKMTYYKKLDKVNNCLFWVIYPVVLGFSITVLIKDWHDYTGLILIPLLVVCGILYSLAFYYCYRYHSWIWDKFFYRIITLHKRSLVSLWSFLFFIIIYPYTIIILVYPIVFIISSSSLLILGSLSVNHGI